MRVAIVAVLVLVATGAPAQDQAVVDRLLITAATAEEMRELQARDKFAADPETGYPGLPNQGIARKLDRALNASFDILLSVAQESHSRAAVLDRVRGFLATARSLGLPEAENERVLWCYGQACAILGIAVEEQVLATWLYGSPPAR